MKKSSKIIIAVGAVALTIGLISSTQAIESSAQINSSLQGNTMRSVSTTGKTVTSSLGQTYKLESQGRIEYDSDSDGVPEVIYDASDFEKLFEICK